jgi:hypothetical protein
MTITLTPEKAERQEQDVRAYPGRRRGLRPAARRGCCVADRATTMLRGRASIGSLPARLSLGLGPQAAYRDRLLA